LFCVSALLRIIFRSFFPCPYGSLWIKSFEKEAMAEADSAVYAAEIRFVSNTEIFDKGFSPFSILIFAIGPYTRD